MIYLRQLYKQKPQSYGPPSQVQSSIFANAEREGIDPGKLKRVVFLWEKTGSKIYDYVYQSSHNISGAHWLTRSALSFDGVDDYIDLGYVSIPGAYTLMSAGTLLNDASIANRLLNFYDSVSGKRGMFEFGYKNSYTYCVYDNDHYSRWDGLVPALFNNNHVFASVHDGATGLDFYIDGVDKGSPALTGAPSNDTASKAIIGAAPRSPLERFYTGQVDWAIIASEAYTPSQIAYLSDNPYFLLHRQPSVFYSVPSGAGGTTYQQAVSGSLGFTGAYARQAMFNRTVNGTI